MQSSQENQQIHISQLCASVESLIDDYLGSHSRQDEPYIGGLQVEVRTLYKYLELIVKVGYAGGHRSEIEKRHLRDVDRLLHRCFRTLSSLEQILKSTTDQDTGGNGSPKPKGLHGATFSVHRVHISFYKRTLELSLMSLNW